MTPILVARGLRHRYGDRLALDDVSLALSTGVTALVGVNGAGKSTLLQVLAGALEPTSGQVSIGGDDPYQRRVRRRALPRVALMPQHATFPPAMTVHEVVSHIAWLRGLSARRAAGRATVVLEQVGLADRRDDAVKTLSGGMARRVALAQAVVSEPEVVLLDEPSTGLDPEQRRAMVALVADLDASVLFSSHVAEDVEDVAERVIVLEEGRVLFDDVLPRLSELGAETLAPHARRSPVEAGFMRVLSEHRGGLDAGGRL